VTDRAFKIHCARVYLAQDDVPHYEVITFSGQRPPTRVHFAWNPQAEIRIATSDDGRWMWATSYYSYRWGFGSVPLPKWGRFAPSREAAISAGVDEMLTELSKHDADKAQASVIAWLSSMREPTQGDLFEALRKVA